MINKIEFNETEHKYTLDGVVVPSVTKIISETIGHGWSAEHWYLDRGKAIHACASLIAQGKKFTYDDRLEGYIIALKKFFSEVKPTLSFGTGEIVVASKIHRFCGTIDLPCKISGKPVLIDYKHSIDKIRIALQLGGYSVAASETMGKTFNFGYGVQIKENATYQMTPRLDLVRASREFLALRTTYRIKELCKELSHQKKESV